VKTQIVRPTEKRKYLSINAIDGMKTNVIFYPFENAEWDGEDLFLQAGSGNHLMLQGELAHKVEQALIDAEIEILV
jgi:hypothetical protein